MTTLAAPRPQALDRQDITGAVSAALQCLSESGYDVEDMYSARGARFYDLFTSLDSDEVTEVLRALQGARGPVADLACGTGRFTLPLAARGHSVIAVDLSSAMLDLCRDKLADAPALRRRVQLVQADLQDVVLPHGLAAAVISAGSICLLPQDARRDLLRRIADSLASDGSLLLSVFTVDVTNPDALSLRQVLTLPHARFVATLFDDVDPVTRLRTVCLLPHAYDGRPCGAVAFWSQVHCVVLDELLEAAAAAGLVLQRSVALDAAEHGRGAQLLRLVKAGSA